MHYMALLIFLLLPALSFSADCKQLTTDLAKKFHPELILGSSELSACKVWPYAPDKTLVVLTLFSANSDQHDDYNFYDMDVFVLRTDNHEVIGHLYEKEAFADDALSTDSITLDTAPYQLSSDSRGFGVLFHKKGHAYGHVFSEFILSLYYLKDNTVHRSLRGLSIADEFGEWEDQSERCEGAFQREDRILIIDNKQTNAFNNLKIKEVLKKSKLTGTPPDDCHESPDGTTRSSFILKYDGKKYSVPKKNIGAGFNPDDYKNNSKH